MTIEAQNPIPAANTPAAAITRPQAPTGASGAAGALDDATPAVAMMAVGARPARYQINDAAFTAMCDELGELLTSELPGLLEESPASRLSSFADTAITDRIIEPVAGLQLDVYGDDSDDVSGYYVLVSNAIGNQRHIFLTTGWNELYLTTADADPRAAARDYLETICALANTVIDGLYPPRVAGAEATNMVTIELSDGSCATWLLSDQRADDAAAAIEAVCGPPDSLLC